MDPKLSSKKILSDAESKSASPLKLGEILVLENFLSKKVIQKALSIQRAEEALKTLPLGTILVRMRALSENDIDEALKHPKIRKNIGSLVVQKDLVKQEDLKAILKEQKPGQFIGELLVSHGLLSHNQIGKLLEEQNNSPKLGQILIDQKLITQKVFQKALKIQKSSRTLGEILCDQKLLDPHDLNFLLGKYKKQGGITEIISKLGYVDNAKLSFAKKKSKETLESVEEILLKHRYITSEQLQLAYAKKYNFPFLNLTDFAYSDKEKRELTILVSQKYSEKNLILPLYLIENNLTIAIFQPEQINVSHELMNLYPRLDISTVFVTADKFEELFEVLYSKRLRDGPRDQEGLTSSDDIDFLEIDLDENINETMHDVAEYGKDIEADEIVNFIIKYGILNNASDIHIEQDRENQKLRYRVDGLLQETTVGWLVKRVPEKIGAIISRIKVLANMDIAEKRLPQDGVFRIKYFDKTKNKNFDLDFRVASCRAIEGENITIRILDSRKANVGFDNLGLSGPALDSLKKLLTSSAGMVLISGPTGSGKSSTLYGALRYLYKPDIKIITAEDPIEYSFPGIMQTQINPKIDLTFSRLLRSFLRLDPDVILVGEIRDQETASIAFDAAQTGHFLLSTVHTNDSISAVSRLMDLGIEQSQIASCLLAVVAQRLVRRICPICKENYVPEEREWSMFFDAYPSQRNFIRGHGCESCSFSGYKGRTIISEIFIVDKDIGYALSKGATERQIKKMASETGMQSMLDDGISKLEDTTLTELIRVVPHEMIQEFKSKNKTGDKASDRLPDTDKHSEDQSQLNWSPHSFLISKPEEEPETIKEMFQKVTDIKGANPDSNGTELPQFEAFVTDSFYKTCATFNCNKVSFTIHDYKGRVGVSILPENL